MAQKLRIGERLLEEKGREMLEMRVVSRGAALEIGFVKHDLDYPQQMPQQPTAKDVETKWEEGNR